MLNQRDYYLHLNSHIYESVLSQVAKESIQNLINRVSDNSVFRTLCQLPKACTIGNYSNSADVSQLFINQIVLPEEEYINTDKFIKDMFKLGKVKQGKTQIPLADKKHVLSLLLKYMNEEDFYGMIIEINNDTIVTLSHPLRLFEYIYCDHFSDEIITNIIVYYFDPGDFKFHHMYENLVNTEELNAALNNMCYEFKSVYKNKLNKYLTEHNRQYNYLELNINPQGKKLYSDFEFAVQNTYYSDLISLIPVDILNRKSFIPYYGVLQIENVVERKTQRPSTIKYAPTGNISWRDDRAIICSGQHNPKTIEGLLTLSHYNANSTYYNNLIHPQYMIYVNQLLKVTKTYLVNLIQEIIRKQEGDDNELSIIK